MTKPFDRAAEAIGSPLAPRGDAKARRKPESSIIIPLPPSVAVEGGRYDRYSHPETGAILLVPQGADPADVELPDQRPTE